MSVSADIRTLANFSLLISLWNSIDVHSKGPRRGLINDFVAWTCPHQGAPDGMMIRWHQEGWIKQVSVGEWGLTKAGTDLLRMECVSPTFDQEMILAWARARQHHPERLTKSPTATNRSLLDGVEVLRLPF